MTTADGSSPPGVVRSGSRIVLPGEIPLKEISEIATCEPSFGWGAYARPAILIRSQVVAPAGTASTCGESVRLTRWRIWPAAVCTATRVTGGPMTRSTTNPTLTPGRLTRWPKSTRIHCPTGPSQLPDFHAVRKSWSSAA